MRRNFMKLATRIAQVVATATAITAFAVGFNACTKKETAESAPAIVEEAPGSPTGGDAPAAQASAAPSVEGAAAPQDAQHPSKSH
jgi:hypothetical protein